MNCSVISVLNLQNFIVLCTLYRKQVPDHLDFPYFCDLDNQVSTCIIIWFDTLYKYNFILSVYCLQFKYKKLQYIFKKLMKNSVVKWRFWKIYFWVGILKNVRA